MNDLLRAGLVFEGAKGESKRGRKPMHLYLETRQRCALAVDISASRTPILVTDLLGHPLLDVVELPTRRQPEPLVKELVRDIAASSPSTPSSASASAWGWWSRGSWTSTAAGATRPRWVGATWTSSSPLRAATKLPVVIENSCKACVLAQVWAVPRRRRPWTGRWPS